MASEGGSLYPWIRITGRTLGRINDDDGIYSSEHIAWAFAEGKIGLPLVTDNIAIDAIDSIIRTLYDIITSLKCYSWLYKFMSYSRRVIIDRSLRFYFIYFLYPKVVGYLIVCK
jgi:hypothetical protein